MDQHRCELPDTQVFCLEDTVFIVCTPEPEEPETAPPPRTHAEAARTLMSLRPLVERVLRRWNVPEADLPDVTQTVMLDVLAWWSVRCAEPTPQALREGRAYVAVVARHAAHRHYHLLRRRGETAESQSALSFELHERPLPDTPTEPSPEDTALAGEARAELSSEMNLDSLGAATAPAFWRAFYAYAVLSVPVAVIADSERVPEGTIHSRIRLARQDLQSALRRRRAKKRA